MRKKGRKTTTIQTQDGHLAQELLVHLPLADGAALVVVS